MGPGTAAIAAKAAGSNRRRAGLVVVLVVLGTACGAGQPVVGPAARPIVDRIGAAPEIRQWTFTFKPHSGSPYVGCLSGIDEVEGVVDLDAGAVQVEPSRDAPPVIVTESSLLVATDSGGGQLWQEAPLVDGSGGEYLGEMFGRSLAGFIANGVGEPSPNMTVDAVLDVAASIQRATGSGESGDTLVITVDPDRYRDELVSAGQQSGPEDPTPRFLVSVDEIGRVTALEVDTESAVPGEEGGGHGDGYVLLASYEPSRSIAVPDPSSRVSGAVEDIRYPPPGTGCVFES